MVINKTTLTMKVMLQDKMVLAGILDTTLDVESKKFKKVAASVRAATFQVLGSPAEPVFSRENKKQVGFVIEFKAQYINEIKLLFWGVLDQAGFAPFSCLSSFYLIER